MSAVEMSAVHISLGSVKQPLECRSDAFNLHPAAALRLCVGLSIDPAYQLPFCSTVTVGSLNGLESCLFLLVMHEQMQQSAKHLQVLQRMAFGWHFINWGQTAAIGIVTG